MLLLFPEVQFAFGLTLRRSLTLGPEDGEEPPHPPAQEPLPVPAFKLAPVGGGHGPGLL